MLTPDEVTLLKDRRAHDELPPLRSMARNYMESTKKCKPCGARRLPAIEQTFKSYIIAVRGTVVFKNTLQRLFGNRIPNIRGIS